MGERVPSEAEVASLGTLDERVPLDSSKHKNRTVGVLGVADLDVAGLN
jgi:hypothetical protein